MKLDFTVQEYLSSPRETLWEELRGSGATGSFLLLQGDLQFTATAGEHRKDLNLKNEWVGRHAKRAHRW